MEWIKTTEKLPNKGERVLCSTIYGIQIGWITTNGDWQFCNDGSQFTLEYWMPLPELPCEGKETPDELSNCIKPDVLKLDCVYEPDCTTAMNCKYCGNPKWMH